MKVLQVVHDYLPKHAAGAEIYAHALSKQLVSRGHPLLVFCTEHWPGFTQYAMREREYDGLHVVEMVNNHCLETFEQTYDNPRVDEAFQKVFRSFEPDIVHVHSLMYHSINILKIIQDAGIPIVQTVHDFWFHCEQGGKRLRADGAVCHDVDPALCSRCLATRPTVPGRAVQTAYQMILAFRWMSGINFAGLFARLRRRFERDRGEPVPMLDSDALTDRIAARNAAMREHLRRVDRFLCPSAFLRDELVRFGIDPDRAVVSGYGFDTERFERIERVESESVRFGFLGTVAPLKGVHLLLEAFRALHSLNATLAVHGSLSMYPGYVKRLRELAGEVGSEVTFHNAYDPADVAEILAQIDVLVVPSLWFENQPLTIQEAFLAGVPVIAARLGGMAECVEEEVSGLLYEPGDAASLARAMSRLVEDRALLDKLSAGVPNVKSIEQDAREIEALYNELW